MDKTGDKSDNKMSKYGWHSSADSKEELLTEYDRALAHGGYINHSIFGLEEAESYIYYKGGGIGPADLVEENSSARKTHGDVVIADALTLDSKEHGSVKHEGPDYPKGSVGDRKKQRMGDKKKKKARNWRNKFNFER
jgi:hypothetical protein